MKNISKLLVGILFSALVMSPSFAGEMTVTGGATKPNWAGHSSDRASELHPSSPLLTAQIRNDSWKSVIVLVCSASLHSALCHHYLTDY